MPALKHYYLSAILCLPLLTCGPKPIPQESPLDTAPNHYRRGIAQIEMGNLLEAQREFARAKDLDDDFPGTYVGEALVAIERDDFWNARKDLEEALHKDGDFVDAHIAMGRLAAREGASRKESPDKWLPDALRALNKGLKLDPENPAVYYYLGKVYLHAHEFAKGRQALSRVIEINRGEWVEKAMEEMKIVQMVERAAPGSKAGMEIALVPQITRAELAVLLIEELKLPDLMEKRGEIQANKEFAAPGETPIGEKREPGDIDYSWAKYWIEEVLSLGVSGLELFPDGTFRPDEPLTRASYAMVNQGIITLLSGDRSLTTRYIGEESRFPDVRSDFYAYNAIALSTERGIMQADRRTGNFRPEAPVSGAEALLMMRELQNEFRMEF